MNAKEAIELWYGCDTIEALSQHQIADMLNTLVGRVEQLEAVQQSFDLTRLAPSVSSHIRTIQLLANRQVSKYRRAGKNDR